MSETKYWALAMHALPVEDTWSAWINHAQASTSTCSIRTFRDAYTSVTFPCSQPQGFQIHGWRAALANQPMTYCEVYAPSVSASCGYAYARGPRFHRSVAVRSGPFGEASVSIGSTPLAWNTGATRKPEVKTGLPLVEAENRVHRRQGDEAEPLSVELFSRSHKCIEEGPSPALRQIIMSARAALYAGPT